MRRSEAKGPEREGNGAEQKPLILVLEDCAIQRENNARALEAEGYRVLRAGTMAEARAVLARQRPRLYLLDVNLPDGSGVNLCRELRQRHDRSPVVFLSGNSGPADIQMGYAAGADLYIIKPCAPGNLLRAVANLLAGKGAPLP